MSNVDRLKKITHTHTHVLGFSLWTKRPSCVTPEIRRCVSVAAAGNSCFMQPLRPRVLGLKSLLIPFLFLPLNFPLICQTTVPCATIAGFCCPLVVTMRPIPKDKLERLLHAAHSIGGQKGHPVHIGDPGQCPPSCDSNVGLRSI